MPDRDHGPVHLDALQCRVGQGRQGSGVETSGGVAPTPARPSVDLRLEHEPRAAILARSAVRDLLADQPTTEELRHDAALVVYELVSNAVSHGAPQADGRVALSCEVVDDELVVVVTDGGSGGEPAVGDLDEEADRGRGLAIVQALTRTWSVDRSHGTAVRAVLPLTWPDVDAAG
jgi:anti-sigma regulatory factor (Ser/Thr protein kinase)